ncbi:hypothetical protein TSOC_014695, partial [Tetrabaena socialis]
MARGGRSTGRVLDQDATLRSNILDRLRRCRNVAASTPHSVLLLMQHAPSLKQLAVRQYRRRARQLYGGQQRRRHAPKLVPGGGGGGVVPTAPHGG